MRKTLLVAKCGICIETMMPNESAQCMMSDRFAVPSPISREYAGIGSVLLSKMFNSSFGCSRDKHVTSRLAIAAGNRAAVAKLKCSWNSVAELLIRGGHEYAIDRGRGTQQQHAG